MKRKILVTILALVVAVCSLGLFACGDGNENENTNDVQIAQYFVFDNVTVNRTMKQTTSVSGSDSPIDVMDTEASIKLNNGKWNYVGKNAAIGGETSYDLFVNYDGENTYVTFAFQALDNVKDESYNHYGRSFLTYLGYIIEYEDNFVKSSEGVYTADEINYHTILNFSDIVVTIANDKMTSIKFTSSNTNDNVIITQEYEYTFTDWGQTVVD